MNLYDLSIGEDKMNQFLSIALKTHFETFDEIDAVECRIKSAFLI